MRGESLALVSPFPDLAADFWAMLAECDAAGERYCSDEQRARALGLGRVLLICDIDNIASARIIEQNGGILASQGHSPASGRAVSVGPAPS